VPRISENQFVIGALFLFAVYLFLILPFLYNSADPVFVTLENDVVVPIEKISVPAPVIAAFIAAFFALLIAMFATVRLKRIDATLTFNKAFHDLLEKRRALNGNAEATRDDADAWWWEFFDLMLFQLDFFEQSLVSKERFVEWMEWRRLDFQNNDLHVRGIHYREAWDFWKTHPAHGNRLITLLNDVHDTKRAVADVIDEFRPRWWQYMGGHKTGLQKEAKPRHCKALIANDVTNMKNLIDEVVQTYQRITPYRMTNSFDTSEALAKRIKDKEAADLVVLLEDQVTELIDTGDLLNHSFPVARSDRGALSAGIPAKAQEFSVAKRFIGFLHSPEVAKKMEENGLQPIKGSARRLNIELSEELKARIKAKCKQDGKQINAALSEILDKAFPKNASAG
jgi:hypothetical protein